MHGPSALRRVAALLVPLALAACGGSHGGLAPQPYAPQAIAGTGVVAARDLGRRDARKPVSVVVQLRYNRTRELERAIEQMADPHSSQFHHFLTKEQFEARYAPSAAQEREALAALRAAGFTIDRRYANRALIDAHAPSATVERAFATEIHDFAQGRFGTRFANVRPVTLPAALARTVASVDIDTVVLKHTFVSALPALALPPGGLQPSGQWGAIANGGFETGKLHPWTACASKTTAPRATVAKLHPFAGTFDALTGTQTTGEPDGLDGICQTVTVPSNKPQLAAFLYQLTDQRANQAGKQLVALFTTAGKPLATLLSAKQNAKAWVAQHWSLQQYAGKKVVVFFGVDGGGESNASIQQFVDNVTLVSGTPSPSPSPSSSPRPSPTPTGSPRPTPTPTPAGTPAPTPTPGGSLPTGPGTPIAGPTYGPNGGWGPLAVASAFDFPVQHGYDGTGETAAIVIDCAVPPADLSSYLSAYSISQTGTVTNNTSLGGPASASTCDNDGLEADLDEETIAGLAPGANIIMYLIPSLDNEDIENAYNLAVSDDRAVAVNSSFGGCESQDATFDTQSDATAVEGAAKGITFSASSGDQGSACYTSAGFVFGVNAPASDPHFVAVGGNESDPLDPTQTTDEGINTPAAWNDCTASSSGNSACATGGGISAVWPLPSYQSGVAGSPDSRSDRNVPDIAFPAVYDEIYTDGIFGPQPEDIVGTSWASPTNVAMLTELAQICQGAGFANQTMYAVFGFGGYSLFTDVTTGNNAYDFPHTKAYHAATGYDNTTGIGMPSAFNLSAAMCGKTPSRRGR